MSESSKNNDRPAVPAETKPMDPALARRFAVRKAMKRLQAKVRSRTERCNCFLDEQPTTLVPRGALQRSRLRDNEAKLIVNPAFHFQETDEPPEEVVQRALPLDGLLRGYPTAWIKDAGTGMWVPFCARGDWADALRSLRPGAPAPSCLPPNVRHTLELANILVADDYAQSRPAQWARICETAQLQFRTQKYAIVRDLIHPFQLGAMRRFYRDIFAGGGVDLGDGLVDERYRIDNEELSKFFHLQLTSLVNRIAAEPVKPSFVYLASYLPGASLKPHVDREQCEFGISLLVDYVPEPDGPSGWPMFLEDAAAPGVVHTTDLGIGDALIYRGRQLLHYRNPLPDAHRSTSYFLFYVRESFTGWLL